jgi:hypothetical protein
MTADIWTSNDGERYNANRSIRLVIHGPGNSCFFEGNQTHITPSGRAQNHYIEVEMTPKLLQSLKNFLDNYNFIDNPCFNCKDFKPVGENVPFCEHGTECPKTLIHKED